MYENILDYHNIGKAEFFNQEAEALSNLIIKKYMPYLSSKEIQTLKMFIKYYKKNELFPDVFPVIEKIMEIFGNRVALKNN